MLIQQRHCFANSVPCRKSLCAEQTPQAWHDS